MDNSVISAVLPYMNAAEKAMFKADECLTKLNNIGMDKEHSTYKQALEIYNHAVADVNYLAFCLSAKQGGSRKAYAK